MADIDLVYLWVDGKDEVWKNKKDSFLNNGKQGLAKDAVNNCRFESFDELKYSIRSVEQNAPWINNIYIVTDN